MAEKAGDLEGEPYGTIEFHVVLINGEEEIHTIDCGLKSPLIGGLKQDLAEEFDVEGQGQTWKYNELTLKDERALWDYGLDGTDPAVITVIIS